MLRQHQSLGSVGGRFLALALLFGGVGASRSQAQVQITVGDPVQVDTQYPEGGFECAVAVDKCDPDNVAGIWITGMARTSDGGSTWNKLDFDGTARSAPTIAYHPFGTYAWAHAQVRSPSVCV